MCPIVVASLLVRYLFTCCTVIPGYDCKQSFWISLIHVDLDKINVNECKYCTKSVWFFLWYAFFIDG